MKGNTVAWLTLIRVWGVELLSRKKESEPSSRTEWCAHITEVTVSGEQNSLTEDM